MSGRPDSHDQTSLPFPHIAHASDQSVKASASERIREEGEDDEANGNRETDIRKKQVRLFLQDGILLYC